MAREIIENGDLYFFYRPKVHVSEVRDLGDVERFYMVMALDKPKKEYRLLVVGQKKMPDILPHMQAPSERDWAIVEYVTDSGADLEKHNLSWESTAGAARTIYPARPVGAAKYQLIMHGDHSELAYVLEAPSKPGGVQDTFRILPEASYIFKIKNPEHLAKGYPGANEKPQYPQDLKDLFDESWINVKDDRLLDYKNAQVLLIGAHKQNVEDTLGIRLEREETQEAADDLYARLHMSEKDHPKKLLIQGEWPDVKEAA
jgi:hypothetical protein